jgi:SAM-dependent methyltransferase
MRSCWCGGELSTAIGPHYRICENCGTAVLAALPSPGHFEVSDDEGDFYGRRYWTEYSLARGLPDIRERARADLAERCLFWLERLLEVTRPPGRALEIGCGHGAFVRLLQELGFEALGTELSSWVVEFAKRTFGVPILRGALETLRLEPGFACIAAFDVLEHVSDPADLVARCADLLASDGVLMLQTPCYRGEGADWIMFQEDEHIHLFTEASIRLLLTRAAFGEVQVRPSLFPYDMWVVATRGQLHVHSANGVDASKEFRVPAAFKALLDLSHQARSLRDQLTSADADRTARLVQVENVTELLRESEEDRKARLAQVVEMTELLRGSEADRAARLAQVEDLTRLLRESDADRAARLAQVEELTRLLHGSEADRAARLAQVEQVTRRVHDLEPKLDELKGRLRRSDADLAARSANLEQMKQQLQESEADRVARLAQVHKLTALLRESEADRVARLDQIYDLTRHLEEAKSDETARLNEIRRLTARLEEVDAHLATRLAQIDELSRQLGETESDRVGRLEQIHELSRMLRELDMDREARMSVIHDLEARITSIERSWMWRLRRTLPSILTGRPPGE